VKGDAVIIPFPFSDLSGSKRRPALVVAALPGEDDILCQITSRHKTDVHALPLEAADFTAGGLPVNSFIRPNKIFTADRNLVLAVAGHAAEAKIYEVVSAIVHLVSH
jgi:mRNA interferase MazF